MGALRALATEGIQKGHMALHARSIAVSAGAEGSEINLVSEHIIDKGDISLEQAILFLKNRSKRVS
jgi:hydroxymethylglutaryl-CoA reductase